MTRAGWEDAALSSEGRNEAREAGRLMRAHGLQFDIVYTSWLSRAIETAWLVLNELDALWLPLIKVPMGGRHRLPACIHRQTQNNPTLPFTLPLLWCSDRPGGSTSGCTDRSRGFQRR